MSLDIFIGLMGVFVPLINTSLICWVIWFNVKLERRNTEVAEQLRKLRKAEREEELRRGSNEHTDV